LDPDGFDPAGFFQKLQNLYQLRIVAKQIAAGAITSGSRFVLSENLVRGLHRTCMQGLLDDAGQYRKVNVRISNSPHVPPNHSEVSAQMSSFYAYVDLEWENKDLIHLASFCLWRMNWVHPFRNGNGRIARELSYLILNVKNGRMLPSKNTVIEQIAGSPQTRDQYNKILRTTDDLYAATNDYDKCLAPMEDFLSTLLKNQIKSNI
jgi:Fic family protein